MRELRLGSACFAFALVVLLTLSAARADGLYERQDGVWGSPNCVSGNSYFYAVGDTYLGWNNDGSGWTTLLTHPIVTRVTDTRIIEEYKFGESYQLFYTWFEGDKMLSASPPP